MNETPVRCLILACGNTLRGDDGVGPWLANWAEARFRAQAVVQVLCRQQWTPELAKDVAHAESVLFIDWSVESGPGSVRLVSIEPAAGDAGLATHHLGAAELLDLGRKLYASLPREAMLLTVGAGTMELGEQFSGAVKAVLPEACSLLEETAIRLLGNSKCAGTDKPGL